MKKLKIICLILSPSLFFASCLKDDLSGKYNSTLAEMNDFRVFYKYLDTLVDNKGEPGENTRIVARIVQFNYTKTIEATTNTVRVNPSFPSNFPEKHKKTASIRKVWGVAYVSSAATVAPLDGAPVLGTPGDYTQPAKYEVTAAAGNKKVWTVVVSPIQ